MLFSQQQTTQTKWVRGTAGPPEQPLRLQITGSEGKGLFCPWASSMSPRSCKHSKCWTRPHHISLYNLHKRLLVELIKFSSALQIGPKGVVKLSGLLRFIPSPLHSQDILEVENDIILGISGVGGCKTCKDCYSFIAFPGHGEYLPYIHHVKECKKGIWKFGDASSGV